MRANECDECQAPLGDNDGGLCAWCAIRFEDERNREWWS